MQLKLHWRFIGSTRADDRSLRRIRILEEIFVIRDGSDNMMIFKFHWQGPLLSSACSVRVGEFISAVLNGKIYLGRK